LDWSAFFFFLLLAGFVLVFVGFGILLRLAAAFGLRFRLGRWGTCAVGAALLFILVLAEAAAFFPRWAVGLAWAWVVG
jgi:hypothetical protein